MEKKEKQVVRPGTVGGDGFLVLATAVITEW
jgi:hypothetical protein